MTFFATWEAAHRFCTEHDIPFVLNVTVFDAQEWGIVVMPPIQ